MRRVVVTGLGLVSPLGCGVDTSWKNILEGRSACALITKFNAESFATKYACEIEVPSNPKLSSPMRYFPTEEEANHFARQYTEKVKNIITNEQA